MDVKLEKWFRPQIDKEIIPALMKQKKEPNYHLNIILPNQQFY